MQRKKYKPRKIEHRAPAVGDLVFEGLLCLGPDEDGTLAIQREDGTTRPIAMREYMAAVDVVVAEPAMVRRVVGGRYKALDLSRCINLLELKDVEQGVITLPSPISARWFPRFQTLTIEMEMPMSAADASVGKTVGEVVDCLPWFSDRLVSEAKVETAATGVTTTTFILQSNA